MFSSSPIELTLVLVHRYYCSAWMNPNPIISLNEKLSDEKYVITEARLAAVDGNVAFRFIVRMYVCID